MAEVVTSLRFQAARPPCANVLASQPFSVGTALAYSSTVRIAVPLSPVGKNPRAHALGTSTRGGCAVSSPTTPSGTGNRLLDRLPRQEYRSLLPQLETLSFAQDEEICHQNGPLSHVFFPTNGVFSTVILMEDGERL